MFLLSLSLFCCQSNAENPDPMPIIPIIDENIKAKEVDNETFAEKFNIVKDGIVNITDNLSIKHDGFVHSPRVENKVQSFAVFNIQQYDETGLRKYKLGSWAEEKFNDELYRIKINDHTELPSTIISVQGKEKPLTATEAGELLSFPEKCGGIHMNNEAYGVFEFFTDKGCYAVVGAWTHKVLEQNNTLPGECEE